VPGSNAPLTDRKKRDSSVCAVASFTPARRPAITSAVTNRIVVSAPTKWRLAPEL
jgi:hypothetical protein